MSKLYRPIPGDAWFFPSIQRYKNSCEEQLRLKAEAEGKSEVGTFDLSKARVFNRYQDDGRYQIRYGDKEENFYCSAEIDINNHEMEVMAGNLTTGRGRRAGLWEMTDACDVTKKLVGEKEKGLIGCHNEAVTPELIGAKFSSLEKFENYCEQKFSERPTANLHQIPDLDFSLSRVKIINPGKNNPFYTLRYASRPHNFVCEGVIDLTNPDHQMVLQSGTFQNREAIQVDQFFGMTDMCSMTEYLLGDKKRLKDCKDKTESERTKEKWTRTAWDILTFGITAYFTYKIGKGLWQRIGGAKNSLLRRAWPILRNLGWANLAGFTFDKVAGIWLSENNPIRKYGYYGAFATGLFAPTVISKTIGKRLVANSLLARTGGFASRFLSRALLGAAVVQVLDWGISSYILDNNYENWVNKRVTDEVYDEHVYDLSWWDLIPILPAVKGVRIVCREALAPTTMNWGVAKDNPKIKKRILKEDREASKKGIKAMKELVPLILTDPKFYDPYDPASYRKVDLSIFQKSADINPFQKIAIRTFIQKLETLKSENIEVGTGFFDEKLINQLKQFTLSQIQDVARFIVAVDQPLNDWARMVFNKDGTLKPGQEARFLLKMIPTKPGEPSAKEQILTARQVPVALEYLQDGIEFCSTTIHKRAQIAGIIDEKGQMIMSPALYIALTHLVSEAVKTREPRLIDKIQEIRSKLEWRLLNANDFNERQMIGDTLRVLGIDPAEVLKRGTAIPANTEGTTEKESETQ